MLPHVYRELQAAFARGRITFKPLCLNMICGSGSSDDPC